MKPAPQPRLHEAPRKLLEDQVIHLKRGRMHNYGFEPCANAFFDFYLSPTHFEPPLLELEDVTFFLFLRKNLNDTNPAWRMPSIRQMMKRLDVSYSKLTAMMKRLEAAHLLHKISGYRQADDGSNLHNDYELSDPLATFNEFRAVAKAGLFGRPCLEIRDTCRENQDTSVAKNAASPVAENATNKQTSFKQTLEQTEFDLLWQKIKEILKQHVPTNTYQVYVEDTQLLRIENGRAMVTTPKASAIAWLDKQMGAMTRRLLTAETGQPIDVVQFSVLGNETKSNSVI